MKLTRPSCFELASRSLRTYSCEENRNFRSDELRVRDIGWKMFSLCAKRLLTRRWANVPDNWWRNLASGTLGKDHHRWQMWAGCAQRHSWPHWIELWSCCWPWWRADPRWRTCQWLQPHYTLKKEEQNVSFNHLSTQISSTFECVDWAKSDLQDVLSGKQIWAQISLSKLTRKILVGLMSSSRKTLVKLSSVVPSAKFLSARRLLLSVHALVGIDCASAWPAP